MKICVCGWYFKTNSEILKYLQQLSLKYPVFIVSHRTDEESKIKLQECGLLYRIIPNIGLEWGAYDWYLKTVWDGESSMLYMHDDIKISDIAEFDRIAALEKECDQAYIFRDEKEDHANQHHHGRMIFLSRQAMKMMLNSICECHKAYDQIDNQHNKGRVILGSGPHTGFWYDPYNFGHTRGKPPLLFTINHEYNQVDEPKSIWHYNEGIYHFDDQMRKLSQKGLRTRKIIYIQNIQLGRRNQYI